MSKRIPAAVASALFALCAFQLRAQDLEVRVVRPITSYRNKANLILPDTDPIPGVISPDEIAVTACAGEYEPASFVVRALSDVKGLKPECTDLKAGEPVIPSSAVDIRVVKCWYQAATATVDDWVSDKVLRDKATWVLVPELLLKDDSLVRVDTDKKENYLKARYPDGDRYVSMTLSNEEGKEFFGQFDGFEPGNFWSIPIEALPVRDSPVLLPVDIPAGTNKQFWVTVHVPEDASPGTYGGRMDLKVDGRTAGSLEVSVRVLPVKLSEPYYTSSMYWDALLDPEWPEGSIGARYKSARQLRAELQNMVAHGVTNPMMRYRNNLSQFEERLKIRKELGMDMRTLYLLSWESYVQRAAQGEISADGLKRRVRALIELAARYGVQEVYFYGIDEARGDALRSQRGAIEALHEAGGKLFSAGYKSKSDAAGNQGVSESEGNFEAIGDLQDLLVCAGAPSKEEAARWHGAGHRIWCYANPQAGVENPEVYRRTFGLALWKNDYDGAATYGYMMCFGAPWNDFDYGKRRDKCFAYPTADGVVDTVQWEGYREGVDDVRYVTTLRKTIEEAKVSGERMDVALSAEEYLEGLEMNVNGYRSTPADSGERLDAIRAEMISYILELTP